jgi:hypothetical protein
MYSYQARGRECLPNEPAASDELSAGVDRATTSCRNTPGKEDSCLKVMRGHPLEEEVAWQFEDDICNL